MVARVGTKLLDVLETGHRIFLYLICKVGQKNNPRRLVARHTILSSPLPFSSSTFSTCWLAVFTPLPPGDLKLPGKREFGWRYALARYEDAPFFFFFWTWRKISENETGKTIGKTKEPGPGNDIDSHSVTDCPGLAEGLPSFSKLTASASLILLVNRNYTTRRSSSASSLAGRC